MITFKSRICFGKEIVTRRVLAGLETGVMVLRARFNDAEIAQAGLTEEVMAHAPPPTPAEG